MTRKDYIAIATALRTARTYCETRDQQRGVERAVASIVPVLTADNPLFDRQRFEAACVAGAK